MYIFYSIYFIIYFCLVLNKYIYVYGYIQVDQNISIWAVNRELKLQENRLNVYMFFDLD